MFPGWFSWSLLTVFVWGVGQVISKKGLGSFSPLVFNLATFGWGLILYTFYALYLGASFGQFRALFLLLLVFITGTYLLYFYVISLEEVSLTGTLFATYPLSTIIFSLIFLGEKLFPIQIFAVGLIILDVVLIGWPVGGRQFRMSKWFVLSLGVAFLVGFADFLARWLIDRWGVGNYLLYYGWAFLPGILISLHVDRKGRVLPRAASGKSWFYLALGSFLEAVGVLCLFTAFAKGSASVVSPVTSVYAAVTVVLAVIFLKERLRVTQAIGITLAVLGVALIGA